MSVFEVVLLSAALAMDAVAVSMANGMSEKNMSLSKPFAIALAFALFQFFMPLVGYGLGSLFYSAVETVAPYLAFALLAFLGGKMISDGVKEIREKGRLSVKRQKPLGGGKLLVQAVATSIDALAVGVTLLALEAQGNLPFATDLCCAVIGAVTFALSLAAVYVGKKIGSFLADKAELAGGCILVLIGAKILIESLV